MTGIYEHKIDDKGRLFIPSDLRDELGDVFYVTVSYEACLSAQSKETWAKFEEKFNAAPMKGKIQMRPLFANAAKCVLDKQGRFLLPQNLRDHAGLKKDVAVVGMGEIVQFWDAEEFSRINEIEATPENLEKVINELEF